MSDGNLIYTTGGHLAYGEGGHLAYKGLPPNGTPGYETIFMRTSGALSFEYWNGSSWVAFSCTPGNMVLTWSGYTPGSSGFSLIGSYSVEFTSGNKRVKAFVGVYAPYIPRTWSQWIFEIGAELSSQHLTWVRTSGNDGNNTTNPSYPIEGYLDITKTSANNGGSGYRNVSGLSSVYIYFPS